MRMLLTFFLLVFLTGTAFPFQEIKLDPDQPYQGIRSDPVTYQIDFSFVVTPPDKSRVLKVWVPLPPSDAIQEVSGRKLSTFPMKVEPKIGKEKVFSNEFAFFEFTHPQGAQIIRHQFTVKTHQVVWNVDPAKAVPVAAWPKSFAPYLRSERLIPVDARFQQLAANIIPKPRDPAHDLWKVMSWVQDFMRYDHAEASLQGNAVHALEKKAGHCSDYHGLCTALGRSLGYPTRLAYGINPYPKNSPSHCKLEAFLPSYGWVCFDVSDTQNLIHWIKQEPGLEPERKQKLIDAALDRFRKGFRDNTWFLQTRGTDYDLEPPAQKKVALVRTIYVEVDGEPLPEPDPGDKNQRAFSWMTVHHYVPDRPVSNPLLDWRSLEK